MEKKKFAKALMITAVLASGVSILAPTYSEAQSSACKWKQVFLTCRNSNSITAEFCIQGGDGNVCGCGQTTRNC